MKDVATQLRELADKLDPPKAECRKELFFVVPFNSSHSYDNTHILVAPGREQFAMFGTLAAALIVLDRCNEDPQAFDRCLRREYSNYCPPHKEHLC